MFQLAKRDIDLVRSQNMTSRENKLFKGQNCGSRYLPNVFTEQGIAMLSAILRSDVAIEVSIKIIDTFVKIWGFLAANQDLYSRLDMVEHKQLETSKKIEENDKKFERVFDYIAEHK